MVQTNVFDYVRILDKAADASWLRNQAISNNIANMDSKVSAAKSKNLSVRTFTDYSNYSYRLDGNNVDIENENVMLAENQLKYQGLLTGIQQEFTNLQTVMK